MSKCWMLLNSQYSTNANNVKAIPRSDYTRLEYTTCFSRRVNTSSTLVLFPLRQGWDCSSWMASPLDRHNSMSRNELEAAEVIQAEALKNEHALFPAFDNKNKLNRSGSGMLANVLVSGIPSHYYLKRPKKSCKMNRCLSRTTLSRDMKNI